MRTSSRMSGPAFRVVRGPLTGALAALVLAAVAVPAGAQGPTDDVVDSAKRLAERSRVLPSAEAGATRAQADRSLVGTFLLDPGECDGPSGTYFRMVQPGGSPDAGPYVDNNDSPCDDASVTPLEPGTDGGLITGSHQPQPDPAFDGNGGRADRITRPQPFFGTDFAVATNPTDPQTGIDVPPPDVRVDASGALRGDLRSFAAAWQTQHFNQGSPKPDGSASGGTRPVSGSYEDATGRFTLEWSSQIEGGPFNNFTGVWHLEGTFRPASPQTGPTSPAPADDAAAGSAAPGATAPGPAASAGTEAAESTTTGGSGSLADTGGRGLSVVAVLLLALAMGAFALLRGVRW